MAAKDTSVPYQMKESDTKAHNLVPTVKAFDNNEYLGSHDARIIRILCEFQEPQVRLRRNQVKGTMLFFGSARSMSRGDFNKTMDGLLADLATATDATAKTQIETKVAKFRKVEWMCEYAELTEELARRLTEWAMRDSELKDKLMTQPEYLSGFVDKAGAAQGASQPLVVLTGGGPGIMEAANRGAARVPGSKSMGMGISLPFEKGLNPYVTPDLAFEFHYFFTRKFWMMYSAKALIVGPGGFGTMDEFFELMTLRQTGKIPDLPIVFLGSKYWKTVVNWQAMADFGTISQEEVDRLCFADDVDTAFNFITENITSKYVPTTPHASPKKPADSPNSSVPALSM